MLFEYAGVRMTGKCNGPGSANAALSFSNAEQTTEISQSGFLDLFDTNLGTLNSVTLTLNGSMTTTIDLSNSAAQSQTARGTGTVDLTFASSWPAWTCPPF
jgi:hypothetical protein